MILIGSQAILARNPKILKRSPKDYDFICSEIEFSEWLSKNHNKINLQKTEKFGDNKIVCHGDVICEFEIIKPNSSAEILNDVVKNDPETIETSFGLIPSIHALFAIKSSHRFRKFDDNLGYAAFWKTAIDYHLMKTIGAKIKPEYNEFINKRSLETYKNKLPKLNMSKEDFFDGNKNGIDQIYDHDDLHKCVAINDRPAYTYYLQDNSPVLTSKKKFFEVSEDIRLAGICEEAIVLSLERSLIPFPNKMSPDQAFRYALAKVSSSITSGYFRSYAYENLFKALKIYPKDYYSKFQEKIQQGLFKKIGE